MLRIPIFHIIHNLLHEKDKQRYGYNKIYPEMFQFTLYTKIFSNNYIIGTALKIHRYSIYGLRRKTYQIKKKNNTSWTHNKNYANNINNKLINEIYTYARKLLKKILVLKKKRKNKLLN